MEGKKIVLLSVLVTALLLALASGPSAAAEVRRCWTYTGDYDDEIDVEVRATVQAYPGDRITIEVRVEALDELYDATMDLWVVGSEEKGYDRWESDELSVLYYDDLDDGDRVTEDYRVTIPTTVDPGLVCGEIVCEWEVRIAVGEYELRYFDIAFPMTYLLNKGYEDLLVDYDELETDYEELETDYADLSANYMSLNAKYTSLKADYDSLKATYESLKSSYDKLKTEHTTLTSDYEALKKKHSSLESEHEDLQADYEDLESDYEITLGELSNYTTYTYALAVATVVFIITTIIFAVRRPSAA